uniref:Uncharacterized protein n=1 Tax=Panagrolaimus superbus TaxID=310955 RepID=A0A914XU33_9BILA
MTVRPDEREYMAESLLFDILKKKCPKSALEYSRLVIAHSDNLDYRNVMDKRKAEGITAWICSRCQFLHCC